jgi:hypothetical protein
METVIQLINALSGLIVALSILIVVVRVFR